MENFFNLFSSKISQLLIICTGLLWFTACQDDDTGSDPPPVIDESVTYYLNATAGSNINGYVVFYKDKDNAIVANVSLAGTTPGNSYPIHVHQNSAIEGGDIVISLENVDGVTGKSQTVFTQTDAGNAITFEDFLNFDGYINVHASESDLGTLVSQSDIGSNLFTGNSKTYALNPLGGSDIGGEVTFEERKNGSTKVTIELDTTIANASYPAHIHVNSAAETGGIAINLIAVDGASGMSVTNIRKLNDDAGGTPITYSELLEFDGYINLHKSAEELNIVVSQTDIGQNELTGNSETYPLREVAVDGIMGTATFAERMNGNTLVTLSLEGTADGGVHPAHIHGNTAAETGGIEITLNSVNGTTGMSVTNVTALDAGTAITYEELLVYNGYINVHASADDLGTIVAQGDIGENALNGEQVTYRLDSVDNPDIKGTATFYQRNNGLTLVELKLENTPEGGVHPAHIHANTAAEGGGIQIDLDSVNGTTGMSMTTIRAFNDGTPVTYEELLEYDGYINVHASATDLATIVGQGDIGANALTGDQTVYTLNEVESSGISGTATFAKRKNGFTLITLKLDGTVFPGDHPAHIHFNSAAEGGGIAVSLTNVVGGKGISKTNVETLDNNSEITYDELIEFDGYINVHLSPIELGQLLAQGNIGSNVE